MYLNGVDRLWFVDGCHYRRWLSNNRGSSKRRVRIEVSSATVLGWRGLNKDQVGTKK
jgi:hypothetical protein